MINGMVRFQVRFILCLTLGIAAFVVSGVNTGHCLKAKAKEIASSKPIKPVKTAEPVSKRIKPGKSPRTVSYMAKRSRVRRDNIVRVALATNRDTAAAGSTAGMTVFLFFTGKQESFSVEIPAESWLTVFRGPGGLLSVKIPRGLSEKNKALAEGLFRRVVVMPARDSLLRFKGRRYRGNLDFLPVPRNGFDVVDIVAVEDYLIGVVTAEMPSRAPMEALKAQAVASRSYCLEKILGRSSRNWHLTDGTLSQCYGGADAENARGRVAVAATAGKVLLWNSKPAPAVFSASCGGRTDSAEEVWEGRGQEFLQSMECPFCRGVLSDDSREKTGPASLDPEKKGWEWEFSVDLEDLAPLIGKKNPVEVIGLVSHSYCASGRVRTLLLRYRGGSKEIRAEDLRRIIGPDRIRSTWFEIAGQPDSDSLTRISTAVVLPSIRIFSYTPSPEAREKVDSKTVFSLSGKVLERLDTIEKNLRGLKRILLRGKGHGHGVGMCQNGAMGLAEEGRNFEEILRHYYHGVGLGVFR